MKIIRFLASQIVCVTVAIGSLSYTNADEVSLISGAGGYSTGANINALAGPLFESAITSVDLVGSGMSSAEAASPGNLATHISFVELDYSGGGAAFFGSTYGSEDPEDPLFFRSADLDHRASAESIFHFSVDVPTAFVVDGFFEVKDATGTTVPGNIELEIELREYDAFDMGFETVFYSWQASKDTLDAGFVVGALDGDSENVLIGGPMGILDPTKVYRYRTLVTTNAIDIDGLGSLPATDGGATAFGDHAIIFSAVAVPEPNSALLLGLAVLAFGAKRRRIDSV